MQDPDDTIYVDTQVNIAQQYCATESSLQLEAIILPRTIAEYDDRYHISALPPIYIQKVNR